MTETSEPGNGMRFQLRISHLLELVASTALAMALVRLASTYSYGAPSRLLVDQATDLISPLTTALVAVQAAAVFVERLRAKGAPRQGLGRWSMVFLASYILLISPALVLVGTIAKYVRSPGGMDPFLYSRYQLIGTMIGRAQYVGPAPWILLAGWMAWFSCTKRGEGCVDYREWFGRAVGTLVIVSGLFVLIARAFFS